MSVMQLAFAFTAGFLPFFFGASGLGKARISLSELEVLSPHLRRTQWARVGLSQMCM